MSWWQETQKAQAKPVPVPGRVLGEFHYPFVSRYTGALWAAGWVAAGVAGTVWAFTIGSVGPVTRTRLFGIAGFWCVILFLVLWSLWGWRQTRILMQPVVVTDEGIASNLRPERPVFWPVRNPGFIAFDDITEIAMLANPDFDADNRRWGVSAIRIMSKDKKIVVWKVIQDFARLCALIESEMCRCGKPLRVSPKDVEIPAGTGTTVAVYP